MIVRRVFVFALTFALLACRRHEDPSLEKLQSLWTAGAKAGTGKFRIAAWMEPDPSGKLFVLDLDDQRITTLSPDGQYLGQFGGRGTAPGGLSKTRRFAFVDGRLYFANAGNERIEVLGANGEVFPPVTLPDVRSPGELYFANQRFYVERRFVPDGYLLYEYDRDWRIERRMVGADPKPDEGKFLRSHNTVCVAKDGLWVVYLLQNRIQKIGFDGRVLAETSRPLDWKFPKDENGRVIPEILVHRACAADPAGNLYVIYSNPSDWKRGNDAYKFAPDGHLLGKAFTLPVHAVSFIRFDRDGNFYFSDGVTLTKAKIEGSAGA
ncbi:MAG: hypothetical protein JOZ54_20675 [Acidobacteria bacterium]|nr:hypothetical protein [Acidobacteriota bacterium]